jgi:hypothetical protein
MGKRDQISLFVITKNEIVSPSETHSVSRIDSEKGYPGEGFPGEGCPVDGIQSWPLHHRSRLRLKSGQFARSYLRSHSLWASSSLMMGPVLASPVPSFFRFGLLMNQGASSELEGSSPMHDKPFSFGRFRTLHITPDIEI